MSEEYEDDFEQSYEEDFESEGELELPSQLQPADPCEDDEEQANTTMIGLDTRAWPSLSAALIDSSRGSAQAAGLFARSCLATSTDKAPTTKDQHINSNSTITFQPPLPGRTDLQRKRAAIALQHAKQLQNHVKLRPSMQLELLVLHPLTLYQQFQQGIGVFAHTATAASQTRQLDLDIREQDSQTDEIEQLPVSCQAPEDRYSTDSHLPAEQQRQQHAAAELMPAADPRMVDFVNWAVPQVVFELQRAEAECFAEAAITSSVAQPAFQPLQTASHVPCPGAVSKTGPLDLLTGEIQLPCKGMLAGRSTVGVSAPALHETATAAAAAIAAATASVTVSRHLLLVCCSPVPLPAAEAVLQHNLTGLGCLCVWDLLQASHSTTTTQAGAGRDDSAPPGVLQLLVCEGRPTCCCWGVGAAASLVFAGTEEGGICCWDLSEPDVLHCNQAAGLEVQEHRQQIAALTDRQQLQPHARLPLRRPSCSTEVPLFHKQGGNEATASSVVDVTSKIQPLGGLVFSGSGCAVPGGVVALSAVHSTSGSSFEGAGAAAPVCRLVALTAAVAPSLYSVMRAETGSGETASSVGTRTGSIVWLMKVCEGLPCGMDVVKPLCMRATALSTTENLGVSTVGAAQGASGVTSKSNCSISISSAAPCQQMQHASCLLVLPGPAQQLLVGTSHGRVLKGAVSGATSAPHVYLSQQWTPGQRLYTSAADTSQGSPSMPVSSALSATASSSLGPGVSLGHVTSLSVCPILPMAWAAGHSCGRVAVFSQKCSRPCWTWQHPMGIPVLAVRWLPHAATLVALFGHDSNSSRRQCFLLAFNLASLPQTHAVKAAHIAADITLQPTATVSLSMQPCCMEVLCIAAGRSNMINSDYVPTQPFNGRAQGLASLSGSSQSMGTKANVVIGFADGSTTVYQLHGHWCLGPSGQEKAKDVLQALLSG